ncbi:hypothetical protein [Marinifilum sp. D714]|uniref:hypothetical protein n=1 Tax=Marinifilum sp. D714 TaxID=2937523 RepID=UPI0027BD0DA8|nr:hypothetical protein [Marinifilum sp. D714]MDQ2179295.1 hypothetical protein [Marinifilum sp. D714]
MESTFNRTKKANDLHTFQLSEISKKYAQKEIEASSLVYLMRRKLNSLYHQDLRLIKPVLKRYPDFWKSIEESEKNAKAFMGWLNHMRSFYNLIVNDSKYNKALINSSINISELKHAYILIPELLQAYRKLQKCSLEKSIVVKRLKISSHDFDSTSSNHDIANHYSFK